MGVVVLLPDEVVGGDVGWHYFLEVVFVHHQNILGGGEQGLMLEGEHLFSLVNLFSFQKVESYNFERVLSLDEIMIISGMRPYNESKGLENLLVAERLSFLLAVEVSLLEGIFSSLSDILKTLCSSV